MTFTKAKMVTMLSMLILFFSFCVLFSSPANGQGPPSAYQVLQDYNLPAALLPQGVVRHSLNRTNGQFLVDLPGVCYINAWGFKIKYNPTMTAVISQNLLSDVDGVRVKYIWFWAKIISVFRYGDMIELRGKLFAQWFSINDFISSAQCNN
ncbi:uncharacterized protein At5g01610-like [Rutidosis leptorrhynchoides]|uniref:uncharacterized protein At5g01610-like n=1 Tax=Rutidosis leptorrhynchoides TaxID=125765 RepID=UPI003A9985F0